MICVPPSCIYLSTLTPPPVGWFCWRLLASCPRTRPTSVNRGLEPSTPKPRTLYWFPPSLLVFSFGEEKSEDGRWCCCSESVVRWRHHEYIPSEIWGCSTVSLLPFHSFLLPWAFILFFFLYPSVFHFDIFGKFAGCQQDSGCPW